MISIDEEKQLVVEFNKLVGQKHAKDVLYRAVKTGRLPHAFLFLGNDGVGKETTALDLARSLLCLSDHQRRSVTPANIPCGVCDSCVQISKLAHPNLKILFPMPKPKPGKDESDGENYSTAQQKLISDKIYEKSVDPYTPLTVQGGQEILIEHIRALRSEFKLTSYSGGWRIVLISQADSIRVQAANAFLKLLEEPPENVMFILTSSKESRILPTILSRCQVLRFAPLSEETIISQLVERVHIDINKARASARLSEGSWYSAVRWSKEDPAAEMVKAVNLLRSIVTGDPGKIDKLADDLGAASKLDDFKDLLTLLSKWVRDVQRYDAAPEWYADLTSDEALIKFAKFTENRDFEEAIEIIEIARLDLERRVQSSLVAHNLFTNLWRILFKR
jgi:DNA polymerase III subunit delta'